jgi:hypothetical protein
VVLHRLQGSPTIVRCIHPTTPTARECQDCAPAHRVPRFQRWSRCCSRGRGRGWFLLSTYPLGMKDNKQETFIHSFRLAGYCPSNSGFLSVHHWDVPGLFFVCGVCAGSILRLELVCQVHLRLRTVTSRNASQNMKLCAAQPL